MVKSNLSLSNGYIYESANTGGTSTMGQASLLLVGNEPAPDNREDALWWSDYGLMVVPVEPGSRKPAVRLPTECDRSFVERHWQKNPTHEVWFVLGENLIVVSANSPQALAALNLIEKKFRRFPNLIIGTATGEEHYYWLDKKTCLAPVLDCQHNGHIVMKTGRDIVPLPPHGGRVILRNDACSYSDLPDVGQAFVDSVQQYNRTALPSIVEVGGMQDVAKVVPVQTAEISPAAPKQSGESGGAALPSISLEVPAEGGESGESGHPAIDLATDTTFTTLGAQSACENKRGVSLPAAPTNAPLESGESGESGALSLVNPCAAPIPSMAMQAEASAVMPSNGVALPAGGCTGSNADDIPKLEEFNKPTICIVEGELHRAVDAAEKVLEAGGMHYQSGSMIVSVTTDPLTGDPSIVPINAQTLTLNLSVAARFVKQVGEKRGYKTCDPPARLVDILLNAQSYSYLQTLAGLARQPYYRETDGVLVAQPGYDKCSKLFGVFDPCQFNVPLDPTKEMALAALEKLQELISEFRFANDYDQSAALSAILTAVNRPILPLAPAFHVRAAMSSSGKSFLNETIASFASEAESKKISFPTTNEEATKSIMATLSTCPAVVEFDDMSMDWMLHGIICRMLTSTHLTDRILGISKNATVSTRVLFLSSGNNVGPVRDLLRRVATINLDTRCAIPATLTYKANPVETMRKHRAAYVTAALTINAAWKAAGSPRANVSSIASYGGPWADYCRHPLIWLGHPDPATSLLEQVTTDPDGDNLGSLLVAWYKTFGTSATTVRKVIDAANFGNDALKDAIHELPVVERGEANPGKLGIFLRRNANRIVGALKFVEGRADGRKAWRVVAADAPRSPALPD